MKRSLVVMAAALLLLSGLSVRKSLAASRGDCNSDGHIDAGDISALVLEIFDGDQSGKNPGGFIYAPDPTFPGDPEGCDANADTFVDAGDISCVVLMIFGGGGVCGLPRTPTPTPTITPSPTPEGTYCLTGRLTEEDRGTTPRGEIGLPDVTLWVYDHPNPQDSRTVVTGPEGAMDLGCLPLGDPVKVMIPNDSRPPCCTRFWDGNGWLIYVMIETTPQGGFNCGVRENPNGDTEPRNCEDFILGLVPSGE